MKRLAPVVVLAVVLLTAPSASAQTSDDSAVTADDDKVRVVVSRRRGADDRAPPRSSTPAADPGPEPTYIMEVEVRFVDGVGPCVYLFDAPGDPNGRRALENEIRAVKLLATWPVCPDSPRQPRTASPAAAAVSVWQQQVQLPAPEPYIAPGWAITGKKAYLEVGGDRSVSASYNAFGYDVTIEARSVLDVDWGDGTVERNVTATPGPWPDGGVTHMYTDAGAFTVTVTQRWRADWRIGAATGTIADQLVTTGTFTLEARQLQAVRDR